MGALLMTPFIAGMMTAFVLQTKNDREFMMGFAINEIFLLFVIGFYKFMFGLLNFLMV